MSRALGHLAVIGLVAITATFAIAATRSDSSVQPTAGSDTALAFSLIDRARAADASAPGLRSVTFELQPDPESTDPVISRRVARFEATPAPTPLPTPVAPPPPAPDRPAVAAAPKPAAVIGNGTLGWPVRGVITTYYSASHLAIDIAAPAGTTVHASAAGVVTYAGWRNNGGGNVVQIDHGNGIQTVYNHLGSIWVSVGQAVARGEGIGAVGCTGNCTGPHVHFEVIVNGAIVNPLRYL